MVGKKALNRLLDELPNFNNITQTNKNAITVSALILHLLD